MMNNYSDEFLKCKDYAFLLINKKRNTKKELFDKLLKKEYDNEVASEVVDYLEEAGYIDDYDYARRFISDSVKIKGYGKIRIKRDLILKGVKTHIIDDVLSNEDFDTSDVLDGLIEKKSANLDLSDDKQLQKLFGFLLRRGYGYSEIKTALSNYKNKKESQ